MRVVLISERWERVADEGMLVYLDQLARYLSSRHELHILHARGEASPEFASTRVAMGRHLVSPPLRRAIESFRPELVIYCPTACATIGALYRHRRLQASLSVPAALLSLQSREYPWGSGLLLSRLRPWRLIVLSERAAARYRERGFEVVRSRAGVSLDAFTPADQALRRARREELGLAKEKPLLLHVGHLAAFRNLELLSELAKARDWSVVMVASTANPPDPRLRSQLEDSGVRVVHEFIPVIQHYYQAADLYVFPVTHGRGAIEFPLSVLEAMACDLPVLTTPFGALPEHFAAGSGLVYLQEDEDIATQAARALAAPADTRAKLREFSWTGVMESLISTLSKAANS